MGRRLGGGVPEGEHAVPALHHLGRDLSGRNRTEHARPHTPRLPLPARAVLASERLAQLLPQLLAARALRRRLALDLRQRLQGRPLLGRELRRRPHVHPHVQIALAPLTDARQPLGAQPIDRAGLRARLQLERRGAVGGRYVQLGAERGLRKGERQVVNQVVAMALEARVVGDVEHRDQIAGWAVAGTRHARAAHREIVMVGDAGGDVDLDTLPGAHATVALALGTRVLEHNVPAGVADHHYLTMRGAGVPGPRNGPPGDLIAVLDIADDPRFERHGDDLIYDLPLSFTQAALGAELDVPTPYGAATLKVQPGTQTGAVYRLRAKGLPRVGEGGKGDLHVRAPSKLTPEQRAALEALAKIEGKPPAEGASGKKLWEQLRQAFGR